VTRESEERGDGEQRKPPCAVRAAVQVRRKQVPRKLIKVEDRGATVCIALARQIHNQTHQALSLRHSTQQRVVEKTAASGGIRHEKVLRVIPPDASCWGPGGGEGCTLCAVEGAATATLNECRSM